MTRAQRTVITLSAAVVCAIASSALAQKKGPGAPVLIFKSSTNGRLYNSFTNSEKRMYLAGYYDGMMGATSLGADAIRVMNFTTCIPGLTFEQLKAIVDKYVADNPDKWGEP